eukprot:g2494.t1
MKKVAYALVVCLVVGCALFQADAFAKHQAKAIKKEKLHDAVKQFSSKFDHPRSLQNGNLVSTLFRAAKALSDDHKSSDRRRLSAAAQAESMAYITTHMEDAGMAPLHFDTCGACLAAGDNCWRGLCQESSDCADLTASDLVWGTYGPSGSTSTRSCDTDVSHEELYFFFNKEDGSSIVDFESLDEDDITVVSDTGTSRGTSNQVTHVKGTAISGANVDHAGLSAMEFSISGDRFSYMYVMKTWMVGALGHVFKQNFGIDTTQLNDAVWSNSTIALDGICSVLFGNATGEGIEYLDSNGATQTSRINDADGDFDCSATLEHMETNSHEPAPGHYFTQLLEFTLNAALSVEGIMYGGVGGECFGWSAGVIGIGHLDIQSQTDFVTYYGGKVTLDANDNIVMDWESLLQNRTEQTGAFAALCIDRVLTTDKTDAPITVIPAHITGSSSVSLAVGNVFLSDVRYWTENNGDQYIFSMCSGEDCVDIFASSTGGVTFNGVAVAAGELKVAFRGLWSNWNTHRMGLQMWAVEQQVNYATGTSSGGGLELAYEATAKGTSSPSGTPYTTSAEADADSNTQTLNVAQESVAAANCGTDGAATAAAIEAAIIAEEEFLTTDNTVDVDSCTIFTFSNIPTGFTYFLWDPTATLNVTEAKAELAADGFSTDQAVIIETVTDCIAPTTTTGYTVAVTNSAWANFAATANCATGYTGTATVTSCSAPGQAYVLGGCSVDATASGAIRAIARSTLSSFVLLLISFVLLN